MEKGIQYLRELTVLEVIYNIYLDNDQSSQDSDDDRCPRPMCQKFVQSSPSPYASILAAMTWKAEENLVVDEFLSQYEENVFLPMDLCLSCRETVLGVPVIERKYVPISTSTD